MTDINAYPFETSPLPTEDGGGFLVRFPDIPGCLGVGDTPEDALADGRQALTACIDALKAADRKLPEPSTPA